MRNELRHEASSHAREVESGKRFEFGANWARFLSVMDEDRICEAEKSLREMLELDRLDGMAFLDVGSGSGLFSLAARRLGARVHSFDFDPRSVACTKYLRQRFFADDADWVVEEASVLDKEYLAKLREFDIVYSWGVLHHTSDMWQALQNVTSCVGKNGRLFIALYNDQAWISRYWAAVKHAYVSRRLLRGPLLLVHAPYLIGARWLVRTLFRHRRVERGMNLWRDMIDWVGGYPFEVARPETVFHFYRDRGFELRVLKTCGGRHGCNEFVFVRQSTVESR